MSNCIKKNIFHIKLLKNGFMANDKWRQAPGFELLHHIYWQFLTITCIKPLYWILPLHWKHWGDFNGKDTSLETYGSL